MDKTVTTKPGREQTPMRVSDYKAAIAQMFAEMERLNEQIKDTQAETDRVRAETREILVRLKAA